MPQSRCRNTDDLEPCSQLSIDLLNSVNNLEPRAQRRSTGLPPRKGRPRKQKLEEDDDPIKEDNQSPMMPSGNSSPPHPRKLRRLRKRPVARNQLLSSRHGVYDLRVSPRRKRADTPPAKRLKQQDIAWSDASSGDEHIALKVKQFLAADEDDVTPWNPRSKTKKVAAKENCDVEEHGAGGEPDTSYQPTDGSDGKEQNDNEASSQNEEQDDDQTKIQNENTREVDATEAARDLEEPKTAEEVQEVKKVQDEPADNAEISETESDYGLHDDEFFKDASRVFEQERNWSALVSEARDLIKEAESQRIGVFSHLSIRLLASISDAKDVYSESMGIRQDGEDDSEITQKENEIMETIVERHKKLVARGRIELYRGNDISRFTSSIDETHVYIIPAAVGLLQSCLMAHFLNGRISIKGLDQLIQILKWFSGVCESINPVDDPSYAQFPDRLKTTRVLFRFLLYVFQTQRSTAQAGDAV
ncbi:hypothetical protein PRK78_004169 [Emydomyces testavorans]|uniref:Uncharacterized protein n=1 Tax=Emydomyces testavorans TaxID=2070801 RepID=A0AAF0DJQ6_9EURO|nr:hypothetical protein PRK78_004169 [Emydomyces testavorans]